MDFDQKIHPGSMKSLQKNVLGKLISPQLPTNAMLLMNGVVLVSGHSQKLVGRASLREMCSLACQSHKDHKDVHSPLFTGGVCTTQLKS